ncbi:CwfJ-like family protein [Abeliophyllum distichum]|uniref:CwfJ-like family protein n=1 Tax=Abeliophyllum distichum TaxID=126358 RepID=A0ABD1RG38_9LAMI
MFFYLHLEFILNKPTSTTTHGNQQLHLETPTAAYSGDDIQQKQHESSTRSVDDNVWAEIRNFKKCLIMMFAKQEKDVVFLETVMGLAQQRRHCLVECIPLPPEIAKQAPVYFKAGEGCLQMWLWNINV